jgi:alpha-L-arabinofuranosidase
MSGPATIDVDNYRIYNAEAAYLKYSDENIAKLKASGMRALRTHGLVRTKSTTYNLEQLTNSDGITSSKSARNTLPDLLSLAQTASMQPWLQIEPHLSPKEWLGFVEYLAASYDPTVDTPSTKPWAWKRVKQGQQEPWTSEFDDIYLEIGNETWNGLFSPWTFNPMTDAATGQEYSAGTVYGLFQEYILSTMRSSPYWHTLKPHLKTITGGWANINAYGRDAARASPSSDFLTIAAYNGGWDENEDLVRPTPASFFNVLNQVTQSARPTAKKIKNDVQDVQKNRSRPLSLGTYESGPGYALNGLNHAKVTEEQAAEQETVMKSLAAGTATLDAFLARASEGFTLQNYFTFGTGRYWTSHARPEKGGQAYPAWDLLSLFNQKGTGDLLRVETTQVPTTYLKAYRRREAVEDAPLIAAYATKEDDRLTLILISRRVADYPNAGDSGSTDVTVELPIKSAKQITKYSLTGTYTSHNVFSKQVRIIPKLVSDQITLPTFTVSKLPPGQTVMFVFDGIDKPQ